MAHGTRIPVVLLVLGSWFWAGCESSSPTMPSAPPVGTIELATNSRNGATLLVSQCDDEGFVRPCTRDLDMTFSVVLNTGVARALVRPEFYTASGRLCGATKTAVVSLTAGTYTTLTASSVFLFSATSGNVGFHCKRREWSRTCGWVDSKGQVSELLTQDFLRTYTFANP